MPAIQSKNWTITIKEWLYWDDETCLQEIANHTEQDGTKLVRYLSIGKHLGTTTGYQHCHINLELEKKKTMTFIKSKLFMRQDIHVEIRRTSREGMDEYLAKDGDFKVIINRRDVQPGHRSDLDKCKEIINSGGTLLDCYEECFGTTLSKIENELDNLRLIHHKYMSMLDHLGLGNHTTASTIQTSKTTGTDSPFRCKERFTLMDTWMKKQSGLMNSQEEQWNLENSVNWLKNTQEDMNAREEQWRSSDSRRSSSPLLYTQLSGGLTRNDSITIPINFGEDSLNAFTWDLQEQPQLEMSNMPYHWNSIQEN